MPKHFFVLGLDPLRRPYVEAVRDADRYRFHTLLDFNEVVLADRYPYDELLGKAERQLKAFPEAITGIIGHWDFPTSVLLAHLCEKTGLRCASLRAVLSCEHKYWSRLLQQSVLPDWTPAFCAVDPFAENPLQQITIDYPFWLKPIKAHSSFLGFRIEDAAEFHRAIAIVRDGIRRYGDAFNQALAHITVPAEVGTVDGNWCIAEEIITGKQCGIEGSMLNGEYRIHGIVDTVKDSRNWSFTRYEYPSVWPRHAQQKICDAGEKLLRHIGFDNSPFGIEFFWDEKKNALRILEINTRISQSHSDQFIKVHGVSNHQVPVDLAEGRIPDLSDCKGKYQCAAKFMLRRYGDARVERIPTESEIRSAESSVADSKIVITVSEGQRLSDKLNPDSYSFEIANILVGAQNQRELLKNYQQLADQLHFQFSDDQGPEEFQFNQVRY
ncbi:ATP-grasp domain-containing protein [Microbulbifer marinus]|uniref:ATP-grasp domain-containing protein n=1 Tax=Microbulbifer marinus TaxID=658218 RepID=A0A1H3W8W7_9GAMM|nr:ATP-grasp domain-containing protein [Microbulbifer marinus]SDZ83579.1 ATP-grasp domain-containing protein [Microbulbifer marinus]